MSYLSSLQMSVYFVVTKTCRWSSC